MSIAGSKKYSLWKVWTWALLICLSVLGSACASRQSAEGIRCASVEELPVVDIDDGIALSAVEQRAFQSTGQLDSNLSQQAQRDVLAQFKHFIHRARPTMARFSQRSQIYLAYARKVFRDKGLPEELAYLAIVESGYNSKAVSGAGATGAWQFMPYTGMKYGLHQDWWMDERLDPYKSTEAAADYLAKLYGEFNNWHLAIAAYNAGEGKIGRALGGTGAQDFTGLTARNHMLDDKAQLKEETKQYVPRFLAVCKIMRNLEPLGFAPVNADLPPPVTRVEVSPGTDLTAVAAVSGQSWSEFQEYNAAHKRHVSHAERFSYVYVPAGQTDAVKNARSGNGWQRIVAAPNDTWQNISRKTGVPVAALQAANRGVTLHSGASLRVPCGAGGRSSPVVVAQASPANPANPISPASSASPGKRADRALAAAPAPQDKAPLRSAKQDKISAPVTIPSPAPAHGIPSRTSTASRPDVQERGPSGSLGGGKKSSAPAKSSATYTVQAGDTLWAIARKHKMSPDTLLALNKNEASKPLRPGSVLLLSGQ